MSTPAHYPMPFTRIELAVMSIVDGELCVLLGQREQAPHLGKWALPGGVLRIDLDATLEVAVQRVALERLSVTLPYFKQLMTVGSADRDPRAAWGVSVVYRALIPQEQLDVTAGKRLLALRWIPIEEAARDGNLAFDHGRLIEASMLATRDEIDKLQLPFGFLPARFTLGELQSCCEAILGRRLDKSSFRRRLEERGCLEIVKGEMRTGAFRPAQLYQARSGG